MVELQRPLGTFASEIPRFGGIIRQLEVARLADRAVQDQVVLRPQERGELGFPRELGEPPVRAFPVGVSREEPYERESVQAGARRDATELQEARHQIGKPDRGLDGIPPSLILAPGSELIALFCEQ